MRLLKWLSIRGLLVLLVLLASVPPLVLVLWRNDEDSTLRLMNFASRDAVETAGYLNRMQYLVETTLVSVLDYCVSQPALQNLDMAAVASIFKKEINRVKWLDDMLLIDISGDILYSVNTKNVKRPANIPADAFASPDRPFVGSASLRSDADGRTGVSVLYLKPFTGPDASSRYAVAMSVNASYFETARHQPLPFEKWSLNIVDVSGTLLFHSLPGIFETDADGKIPHAIRLRIMADEAESGSFVEPVADGDSRRIFGYWKLRITPESPVHAIAIAAFQAASVVGDGRQSGLQSFLLTLVFILIGTLLALGVGRTLLVAPIDGACQQALCAG